MRSTPRVLTRLLCVTALVVLPVLATAPAEADAPTATGWWNFATREGLPQPPPPPDMTAGDLLVQSGDPSGATAGSTDGSQAPSAVAAVRFALPEGTSIGALSFDVADGAVADDVRAYATATPWQPVLNGPLSNAPQPTRSRYSRGVLKGSKLVFADIARLQPDTGPLSIVLLPGAADRVVLRKPGPSSLMTEPGTTSKPAPAGGPPRPAAVGGGSSTSSAGPVAGPEGFAAGDVPAAAPGLLGTGASAPTGAVVGPAPSVAVSPLVRAAPSASSVATGTLRADRSSEQRTRYLAAGEAVLVLAMFGLLGWGPLGRLAALTGGRPDPEAGPVVPPRGVGRFNRPREGSATRL